MFKTERLEEMKRRLRQVFSEEQSETILSVINLAFNELVKASDFSELKQIVKELAEAQKRTEMRVEELAEAQKKTEMRVEELAEAQKKTEMRVEELAEAQKQSEKRLTRLEEAVAELAEAQKRTEMRVEELAEAQKRTEKELSELVREHRKTREMLAGVSDTVGYTLEDRSMLYMPYFCKKEFGIDVELIDRRNIVYPDGRFDEINIYIEGKKDGEKVYVIGECKARPGKRQIDSLLKVAERLKKFFKAEVYPFIIGYYYSPDVEEYLRKEKPEIKALKSFELEMKYGQR